MTAEAAAPQHSGFSPERTWGGLGHPPPYDLALG